MCMPKQKPEMRKAESWPGGINRRFPSVTPSALRLRVEPSEERSDTNGASNSPRVNALENLRYDDTNGLG